MTVNICNKIEIYLLNRKAKKDLKYEQYSDEK